MRYAVVMIGLTTDVASDFTSGGVPVWMVALVLAVASPVLVRLYGDHLERRTAERTRRFVQRLARSTATDTAETADRAEVDAEVDEVKGTPHDG